MSVNKLNDIYKAILKYSGMEADDNGVISNNILGIKTPVSIEEKRLVLPVEIQLKNFIPSEKMIFHPLAENVLRGESMVLSYLRKAINVRINTAIGIIGSSLLQ